MRGILCSHEGELMPRSSPYRIELSDEERGVLESLARSYTLPHWQVTRAQMVLLAADGLRNDQSSGSRRRVTLYLRRTQKRGTTARALP